MEQQSSDILCLRSLGALAAKQQTRASTADRTPPRSNAHSTTPSSENQPIIAESRELPQWSQSVKSRPAAPGKTGPPLTRTSKVLVCALTGQQRRCLLASWGRRVLEKYELPTLSPSPSILFSLKSEPPPRHAASWSTSSKRRRCREELCC